MRKKKKEKVEEYQPGKTADLRNVIAEIQKVDQETADLTSVVEEAQKIEKKTYVDRRENVYTTRLLFSSIMDKIFLILILIGFIVFTVINFKGNVFSVNYGFFIRVFRELGIIVLTIICGLILNWLYRCIINTSLSLTRGAIYRECFFPLFRKETSIPLRHVSSISAVNILYIFRFVVIRQYHSIPMIFPTWNNDKFKTRVDEMIGYDHNNITHKSNKNIFQRSYISFIQWFTVIFIMIIIVLGIVHLIGYVFSTERNISGTYLKGTQKITLNVNGTCDLKLTGIKNLKTCKWKIKDDEDMIIINYEYSKNNYFGEEYNTKDKITVGYKNNVLIYNGVEYNKK